MRQNLFVIPARIAGIDVFGFGWAGHLDDRGRRATGLARAAARWSSETRGYLPARHFSVPQPSPSCRRTFSSRAGCRFAAMASCSWLRCLGRWPFGLPCPADGRRPRDYSVSGHLAVCRRYCRCKVVLRRPILARLSPSTPSGQPPDNPYAAGGSRRHQGGLVVYGSLLRAAWR